MYVRAGADCGEALWAHQLGACRAPLLAAHARAHWCSVEVDWRPSAARRPVPDDARRGATRPASVVTRKGHAARGPP